MKMGKEINQLLLKLISLLLIKVFFKELYRILQMILTKIKKSMSGWWDQEKVMLQLDQIIVIKSLKHSQLIRLQLVNWTNKVNWIIKYSQVKTFSFREMNRKAKIGCLRLLIRLLEERKELNNKKMSRKMKYLTLIEF